MYQTGNRREHVYYWYLTEMFQLSEPKPALNGEPYYHLDPNGWPYRRRPSGPEEEALYCRSGMYGSFLSGGMAGHFYGATGLWQGSIEEVASPKMWEALEWKSGDEMRHLKTFVFARGARYQDLVPNQQMLTPSQWGDPIGYKGWAYCAGTPEQDFFLLYFEKECSADVLFRGALSGRQYVGAWFDPRTGNWIPIESPFVADFSLGQFRLPSTPSNNDWALRLDLIE